MITPSTKALSKIAFRASHCFCAEHLSVENGFMDMDNGLPIL